MPANSFPWFFIIMNLSSVYPLYLVYSQCSTHNAHTDIYGSHTDDYYIDSTGIQINLDSHNELLSPNYPSIQPMYV